jgi:hypothetical protein
MGGVGGRRSGVAIAFALLAAGCSASGESSGPAGASDDTVAVSGSGDSDGRVTLPTVPPPTTAPTISRALSPEVYRQERLYVRPDPLGPLAAANGTPPTLLAPGEHTTDVLGIAVTVRLDEWWRLDDEAPGGFVLNRPDAPLSPDALPAIMFQRPVGLAPPRSVADENLLPGQFTVAPEGDVSWLGPWLDEVPQIEVLATGGAVAGDRTGRWYEIGVDPSAGRMLRGCSPDPCVHTWWAGASGWIVARDGESLRYYEFPDPAGPVFVLVAAADDEFDEWVATADRLIRAASFGPSAPHPVPDGLSVGIHRAHDPGEEWRFITFPGLVIRPEAFRFSEQRPGKLRFEPWIRNHTAHIVDAGIVRPLLDATGRPLASFDEVVDELDASALTRLADEPLFDTTAAVYSGVTADPIFSLFAVEPDHDPQLAGWPHFEHVHVWAFDSPIGPLLIAAEAESDIYIETAKKQTLELIEQMSFDCATDSCRGSDEPVG